MHQKADSKEKASVKCSLLCVDDGKNAVSIFFLPDYMALTLYIYIERERERERLFCDLRIIILLNQKPALSNYCIQWSLCLCPFVACHEEANYSSQEATYCERI